MRIIYSVIIICVIASIGYNRWMIYEFEENMRHRTAQYQYEIDNYQQKSRIQLEILNSYKRFKELVDGFSLDSNEILLFVPGDACLSCVCNYFKDINKICTECSIQVNVVCESANYRSVRGFLEENKFKHKISLCLNDYGEILMNNLDNQLLLVLCGEKKYPIPLLDLNMLDLVPFLKKDDYGKDQ
ncbi:hypothetical protein EYV94_11515 [Puteibacter caeruleilacunae]|nr:hypothetical protein EYV94_11515 [Puteibacter caeruleilacunae]